MTEAADSIGLPIPTLSLELQCDSQGPVEVLQAIWSQRADVVRQRGFGQTDEFVAVDRALVLEPLIQTNGHLSRKTMARGVNRGAGHGREGRIDERAPADDYENA